MSYADRQRAMDAAADHVHREWFAGASPEEKALAVANGVDKPDTSRRVSRPQGDAKALARAKAPDRPPDMALLTAEATREAMADHPDEFEDTAPPDPVQTAAADAVASILARIRAHPNPVLAMDAFCFASGVMGVEGLSETALAARHGVTTAAFSKLAVQFCDTLGLPPSRGMRSTRARRSHRCARLNFLAKRHDHAA
jgi:hypothetical protein